jgi:hypothetical protein
MAQVRDSPNSWVLLEAPATYAEVSVSSKL